MTMDFATMVVDLVLRLGGHGIFGCMTGVLFLRIDYYLNVTR
jgi:hypothetical protein